MFQAPSGGESPFDASIDAMFQVVWACYEAEMQSGLSLVKFLQPDNLVIDDGVKFVKDVQVGEFQFHFESAFTVRMKTFYSPDTLKQEDENVQHVAKLFNVKLPKNFTDGYGSLSMLFYYKFVARPDYLAKNPSGSYEFPFGKPFENTRAVFPYKEYGQLTILEQPFEQYRVEETLQKLNTVLKGIPRKNDATDTMLEDFSSVTSITSNDMNDGIIGTTYYLKTVAGGLFSKRYIVEQSYNQLLFYLRALYEYNVNNKLVDMSPLWKVQETKSEIVNKFEIALKNKQFQNATDAYMDYTKRKFENADDLKAELMKAEVEALRVLTSIEDMQVLSKIAAKIQNNDQIKNIIDAAEKSVALKSRLPTVTYNDIGSVQKAAVDTQRLLEQAQALNENADNRSAVTEAVVVNIQKSLDDTNKILTELVKDQKNKKDALDKLVEEIEALSKQDNKTPDIVEQAKAKQASAEALLSQFSGDYPEAMRKRMKEAMQNTTAAASGPITLEQIEKDTNLESGHVVALFNAYLQTLGEQKDLPKEVKAQYNGYNGDKDKVLTTVTNKGKYILSTEPGSTFTKVSQDAKKKLIALLRTFSGDETEEPAAVVAPTRSMFPIFKMGEEDSETTEEELQQIDPKLAKSDNPIDQARLQAALFAVKEKTDKAKRRKAIVFSQIKI